MKIKKFKNIEYLDLMSFVPLSWPAESVGVLKDDREERGEGQVQEPGEEAEGGGGGVGNPSSMRIESTVTLLGHALCPAVQWCY